jgi:transcriptional regulator with XRE-family HTH domain
MDDLAFGRLLRELRIRLGWPQSHVAAKAGISQSAYSRIERGALGQSSIGKLRRVAAVLEVRLILEPRWRGAAIDRVMSVRHGHLTERVGRLLVGLGWVIRPEVSFSHYGERGVVDIVAWHVDSQTALLVEVKTELVDANSLLAVTDRRRRLANHIVAPFGWQPRHVAEWVAVADSRTNRRRLAAVRTVIRAALPANGHDIGRWLRRPDGPIAAFSFLADSHDTTASQRSAPRMRVRQPKSRTHRAGMPV